MNETKEYDLFKKYPGNRPIDQANLNSLVSSISSKNLLKERPIIINDSFEVLDGQHRLEAAKTLQIPIFYILKEGGDFKDVVLLNSSQKSWKTEDFLRLYADGQKIPEYVELKEFMEKNNFKLGVALLIKQGPFKEMKDYSDFKEGKFSPKLCGEGLGRLTYRIKHVLSVIKNHNIKPAHRFCSTAFIKPLILFLSNGALNWQIFEQKLEQSWFKIGTRPSCNLYMEMLCDIYNFRNQNKIFFDASDLG